MKRTNKKTNICERLSVCARVKKIATAVLPEQQQRTTSTSVHTHAYIHTQYTCIHNHQWGKELYELVNALHLSKVVMPLYEFLSPFLSVFRSSYLSVCLLFLFQLHMFSEMVHAFVLYILVFWYCVAKSRCVCPRKRERGKTPSHVVY